MSALSQIKRQLGRFSLVGFANTGVDFIATNVLFFLFLPATQAGLLIVSLSACMIAMLNSYLLNSRWTFADSGGGRKAGTRFFLTALVGMAVNTTVFLFLMRHLPLSGLDDGFVLLNLSRLGGVIAAMAITFCGYRLWAFAPDAGPAASVRVESTCPVTRFPSRLVIAIMGLGLVTRVLFLWMAPVIYGDAVNYAWVARLTGSGELESVDLFWHSLFDFWQVLFVWLGAGQHAAPVLASLVPGVLVIWPIALITWRLFGNAASVLAATVAALHPRLVEYSLNGYAESFYLLGAVWAVWGAITLIRQPRSTSGLIATGMGLSAWVLVRNEAVVFAAMLVAAVFVFHWKRWRELLGTTSRVAVIVCLMISGYALTNLALWGQPGLMQKGSNLAREHVEMLDPREAARETYGQAESESSGPSLAGRLSNLAGRWPGNVRYTAERLPGILLSPLLLFALLLPLLQRRRNPNGESWPMLLFGAWPLLFYPFIQLEPRMLFPTLIAVIVFGSAGLWATGRRLAQVVTWRQGRVRHALAAAVIALLLPLIPLLAWHSSSERGFHRDVGRWIRDSVPADTRIVGDGYGYVAASAFWAGRRAEPRLWTEHPSALVNSIDEDSVLLLYERYLRESNPELLATLDEGLPGMTRVAEFEFDRVGRIQAWMHTPVSN
jgi:putative flippase GtrA